MINLKEFLKMNVDEYLFGDMRTMAALGDPDKGEPGVAFPLLMTTFSGIELLGTLVSSERFDKNKGAEYFYGFWEGYLYPNDAARAASGRTLYKLVRHGLAHVFALKGNIAIYKHRPELHMVRDADGVVCLDAAQLADDLEACYDSKVRHLAVATSGGVNENSMTARLNEMAIDYGQQADSLLEHLSLPAVPAGSSPAMSQSLRGPQGPTGPSGVSVSGAQGASGPSWPQPNPRTSGK